MHTLSVKMRCFSVKCDTDFHLYRLSQLQTNTRACHIPDNAVRNKASSPPSLNVWFYVLS